jgi:cyclohexadieny/prephenate dehydrogenase
MNDPADRINGTGSMKIGIIGFGLMGASLALALREAEPALTFVIADRDPGHREVARRLFPDAVIDDDLPGIAGLSDILFLATPVRTMGAIVQQIGPFLKPDMILTDLGSVKEQVIRDVAPHVPGDCHFIPGHPVAGRERSGPNDADPLIFKDRNWVLTPDQNCNSEALDRLTKLLERLPIAHVLRLDAPSHDRVLAFNSHLPHIIAFAAMLESAKIGEDLGVDMRNFSGGSYDDMTRVAAADPVMWRDIFLTNGERLEEMIRALIGRMENILDAMHAGDETNLTALIAKARELKIRD